MADAFQRHVSGALDGPFVVLFEQQSADEAGVLAGRFGYEAIATMGFICFALALVMLLPLLLKIRATTTEAHHHRRLAASLEIGS